MKIRLLAAVIPLLLLPLLLALPTAILMWWLSPRFLNAFPTAHKQARERERLERATLLSEALAAHLVGGAGMLESLEAVAGIDDADLGRATRNCAQLMRLGSADPFAPWRQWDYLERLATDLTRVIATGGSAASAAMRAARVMRQEELRRRRIAVERVAVRASIPVSLCLLPAFILLAVVPPAVSLFSQVQISSTPSP